MTNDNHDPLRDLIHQSLVSDKLTPSAELRSELEQRLDDEVVVSPAKPQPETKPRRRILRAWHVALVVAAALVVMVYFSLPEKWQRMVSVNGWTAYPQAERGDWRASVDAVAKVSSQSKVLASRDEEKQPYYQFDDVQYEPASDGESKGLSSLPSYLVRGSRERNKQLEQGIGRENVLNGEQAEISQRERGRSDFTTQTKPASEFYSNRAVGGVDLSPEATQGVKAGGKPASAQETYTFNGKPAQVSGVQDPTDPTTKLVLPRAMAREEESAGVIEYELKSAQTRLESEQAARRSTLSKLTARLTVVANDQDKTREVAELSRQVKDLSDQIADGETRAHYLRGFESAPGTEQYDAISDNPFLPVKDAPLSTFSIDVDTASYANVRRFLTQGQVPPADAVRIEELLNYFSYDYPAPKGDEPFSVNMETAPCPWREEHLLLRVALRGKEVHKAERPPSNLVFLIDTSGSMSDEDKLPLVKQAMSMLTGELGERDRITIVTYAGEAGLKLAPTNGSDRATITSVINSLNSNGSTHGSAGIQLAYEKAREQFIKEGTNRVILCTDGDLNVGVTQDDQLVDLISKEAKSGVFLTVLGFGQGNLKDSKMEKLADHGNGVYAYIDGVREAKKVLVDQIAGTLETIAKDVKIQIEFNPAQVRGYRLIGYENRVLAAKDFNDDTKDAGEIGAGHTVTALYELVPAGAAEPRLPVEELKYQKKAGEQAGAGAGGKEAEEQGSGGAGEQSKELLTLKLRFKQPDGDVSTKIEYPLSEKGTQFRAASADFRFAASVAAFGMILRDSPYRGAINMSGVGEIAASSLGEDVKGYRAEFLDLVRRAEKLGKR
jgi:Ca-activated chloride channel family protein